MSNYFRASGCLPHLMKLKCIIEYVGIISLIISREVCTISLSDLIHMLSMSAVQIFQQLQVCNKAASTPWECVRHTSITKAIFLNISAFTTGVYGMANRPF